MTRKHNFLNYMAYLLLSLSFKTSVEKIYSTNVKITSGDITVQSGIQNHIIHNDFLIFSVYHLV